MRRFRCYHCVPDNPRLNGTEFEVQDRAKPVCPECGADEVSGGIVPLVDVHFMPPASEKLRFKRGSGTLACEAPVKTSPMHTTNPASVTCPACLASQIWLDEAHTTGFTTEEQKEKFLYRSAVAPAPATVEARFAPTDAAASWDERVKLAREMEDVPDNAGPVVEQTERHLWTTVPDGGPKEESGVCLRCGRYASQENEPCEAPTKAAPKKK